MGLTSLRSVITRVAAWWAKPSRAERQTLAMIEAMQMMANASSAASTKQAEVMLKFLEMFTCQPAQVPRQNGDMYQLEKMEADRAAQAGFPVNGTEREKLMWMASNLDQAHQVILD